MNKLKQIKPVTDQLYIMAMILIVRVTTVEY